jgi:uncharacterized repeat protein (TIGR01451 family)
MKRHSLSSLVIAAAWLLAWAPQALAADTLELRNEVFQEIDVKNADGTTHLERVPAAKVVPGTEVIYVITYHNTGAKPATDVVITNPVPAHLAYQPERGPGPSAAPDVSVDSGASFGALASLKVKDAEGKPRPAQGSDVTHLRWRLRDPVAPGAQGSVSYRAVLE